MISPDDRGFLLGDGLFETLLIAPGAQIRDFPAHLNRLQTSLRHIYLDWVLDPDAIQQKIERLITRQQLKHQYAIARITLSRGQGRGVDLPAPTAPTLSIRITPYVPPRLRGARAWIVASVCRNEHSILSRLKSLNYLESILARQEAKMAGADEAILLNTQKRLACFSVGNLFLVDGEGRLKTPPLSEGVLPGITREKVLLWAEKQKQPIEETPIEVEALWTAAELFFTNSLVGIWPMTHVQSRPIGSGNIGPLSQQIGHDLQPHA